MRIGILGAGQLAQLLAHAAYQLGLETLCYSDSPDEPAARNSPLFIGNEKDSHLLKKFAESVDLITLENENTDVATLSTLSEYQTIHPHAEAIRIAQDRLLEKDFFSSLEIPLPYYCAINTLSELESAVAQLDAPAILKTRRFGYDGKGQYKLQTLNDCSIAWETTGKKPAILEAFFPFDYEVSLIAARNTHGAIQFFPLIKNHHVSGILATSILTQEKHPLQSLAENHLTKILNALNYVGVLTIEFFVKDNVLYANEMAPRVHNSGHLTIEACNCSQFEMHLRAICGMALPTITVKQPTVMINLISEIPGNMALLKEKANLHFYDYGKAPRLNRKLGHMTLWANDESTLLTELAQI